MVSDSEIEEPEGVVDDPSVCPPLVPGVVEEVRVGGGASEIRAHLIMRTCEFPSLCTCSGYPEHPEHCSGLTEEVVGGLAVWDSVRTLDQARGANVVQQWNDTLTLALRTLAMTIPNRCTHPDMRLGDGRRTLQVARALSRAVAVDGIWVDNATVEHHRFTLRHYFRSMAPMVTSMVVDVGRLLPAVEENEDEYISLLKTLRGLVYVAHGKTRVVLSYMCYLDKLVCCFEKLLLKVSSLGKHHVDHRLPHPRPQLVTAVYSTAKDVLHACMNAWVRSRSYGQDALLELATFLGRVMSVMANVVLHLPRYLDSTRRDVDTEAAKQCFLKEMTLAIRSVKDIVDIMETEKDPRVQCSMMSLRLCIENLRHSSVYG